GDVAEVKRLARTLDERVMQPVRPLLGETRQIFLSPDGALNLIPFGALVDERDRYLVETLSLTYLTSGRDLLRLQVPSQSTQPPVVIADPLFEAQPQTIAAQGGRKGEQTSGTRSFDFTTLRASPLPGTAAEAKAIGALWPQATVLTQAAATESAVKQVRSPRVLHIATHGFFLADQPEERSEWDTRKLIHSDDPRPPAGSVKNENPLLRAGLLFAGANRLQGGGGNDGILTALEAAGLDLWGTQLVALSACETGIGEVKTGDGVHGLRRALVLAGSQSQVMSLWQVSDVATRDLMVSYYTRLRAGEGRTEALRQVQLAMLGGQERGPRDYRHPFYWASFIPSGDWRSLSGGASPLK
ncbi:MAG: CHAT domain-containing protein, partial [Acidobacteria bacterium]|nr:CHAT domain-containing protein [Acidobacteriota bacterium]